MCIITALILAMAIIIPACVIDGCIRLYSRVMDSLEWRRMRRAWYPRRSW